jgi:hypothetical protein
VHSTTNTFSQRVLLIALGLIALIPRPLQALLMAFEIAMDRGPSRPHSGRRSSASLKLVSGSHDGAARTSLHRPVPSTLPGQRSNQSTTPHRLTPYQEPHMSRARLLRLPVLLTATMVIGALNPQPAEAMRRELKKLPDCNPTSQACREWRQGLLELQEMNTGGGEIVPKPRNKSKAMQACIRYHQQVEKQTAAQATATCQKSLADY